MQHIMLQHARHAYAAIHGGPAGIYRRHIRDTAVCTLNFSRSASEVSRFPSLDPTRGAMHATEARTASRRRNVASFESSTLVSEGMYTRLTVCL